jgi:hypothetical protein
VTSPASGAGSAPNMPDYAPITQSAPGPQSMTGRAVSPGATAGGGDRRQQTSQDSRINLRGRGREVCDAAPHATSVYSLLKFQDEGEP